MLFIFSGDFENQYNFLKGRPQVMQYWRGQRGSLNCDSVWQGGGRGKEEM